KCHAGDAIESGERTIPCRRVALDRFGDRPVEDVVQEIELEGPLGRAGGLLEELRDAASEYRALTNDLGEGRARTEPLGGVFLDHCGRQGRRASGRALVGHARDGLEQGGNVVHERRAIEAARDWQLARARLPCSQDLPSPIANETREARTPLLFTRELRAHVAETPDGGALSRAWIRGPSGQPSRLATAWQEIAMAQLSFARVLVRERSREQERRRGSAARSGAPPTRGERLGERLFDQHEARALEIARRHGGALSKRRRAA